MAFRRFIVNNLGEVSVYKRRGAKHIRLSVRADGSVRVTVPAWTSYAIGLAFAEKKAEWLRSQRPAVTTLSDGAKIGKAHRISYSYGTSKTLRTKVTENQVVIHIPTGLESDSGEVQLAITKVCIRALKKEARALLPMRLEQLADKHNFTYGTTTIKHLKGRWGSCSHKRDITLNCFLMQLPWKLIDYVLLHELTHTVHMSHSTQFWANLKAVCPEATQIKKELKLHQPILVPTE